ncbi:unnamed protein product [Musa acuminata subsp. malaccensis]|uniref:(wild Malaysian banana) hypothetical protein n=1 Tax=Musa acuminata subsp. malaccensis TaxID=214687 RepID=A0A804KGI6_MUSAM|nr:unnamed protein product [Musa acuminata subsp. malaccensis]
MDSCKIILLLRALLVLISTGTRRSNGEIPESKARKVKIISAYEMAPLLQSHWLRPGSTAPLLGCFRQKIPVWKYWKGKGDSRNDWTLHAECWSQYSVAAEPIQRISKYMSILGKLALFLSANVLEEHFLEQLYGDGPNDELGLESNGDYTRKFGYLDF